MIANNGIVGAEARAAFERAVALDPGAIKPRFFLALALTQENRKDEAIAAWQALLDEAEGGEAWAEAVRVELAKLGVETEVDEVLLDVSLGEGAGVETGAGSLALVDADEVLGEAVLLELGVRQRVHFLHSSIFIQVAVLR